MDGTVLVDRTREPTMQLLLLKNNVCGQQLAGPDISLVMTSVSGCLPGYIIDRPRFVLFSSEASLYVRISDIILFWSLARPRSLPVYQETRK